jgi:hypothetical protein
VSTVDCAWSDCDLCTLSSRELIHGNDTKSVTRRSCITLRAQLGTCRAMGSSLTAVLLTPGKWFHFASDVRGARIVVYQPLWGRYRRPLCPPHADPKRPGAGYGVSLEVPRPQVISSWEAQMKLLEEHYKIMKELAMCLKLV